MRSWTLRAHTRRVAGREVPRGAAGRGHATCPSTRFATTSHAACSRSPNARDAWPGTAPSMSSGSAQIRDAPEQGLTLAAIRRVVTRRARRAPTPTSPPPWPRPGASGDDRAPDAGGVLGPQRRSRLADPGRRARGHPARAAASTARSATPPADIEMVAHGAPPAGVRPAAADLLALARDADDAMRGLAERAVELFDEHVRKPIRDTAGDDDERGRADGGGVRRAAARRHAPRLPPLPARAAGDGGGAHRGPGDEPKSAPA